MKTPTIKVIDLVFTRSLQSYRTMSQEQARATIVREWPEQTAALMINFLFDTSYPSRGAALDLIECKRKNGLGNYLTSLYGKDGK